MKKTVIFVLVALILTGCANEPSDTKLSESKNQVESFETTLASSTSNVEVNQETETQWPEHLIELYQELIRFEIVDGEKYAIGLCDQYITRSAFSELAVRLIQVNAEGNSSSNYSDLPDDPEEREYLLTAINIGIISAYPDNTVRPNDRISYEEAIKGMLTAMSYDRFIEQLDNDHNDYIRMAEDFGLMRNIICNYQNPITYGDVLHMLRNALDFPKVITIDRDGQLVLTQSEKTLYDIYSQVFP